MFAYYGIIQSETPPAAIKNLDSACVKMLKNISSTELKILSSHPDLVDRIRFISKFTLPQILEELRNSHKLEVDQAMAGTVWVGTEKLEEALPEWFNSNHCGWMVETHELLDWAKDL